jgi:hypothetical protein
MHVKHLGGEKSIEATLAILVALDRAVTTLSLCAAACLSHRDIVVAAFTTAARQCQISQ